MMLATGLLVAAPMTAEAAVAAMDFSDLVTAVSPGVVRVNVTKEVSEEELAQAQTAELLRQFFGNRINIPRSQIPPAIEHAYGTAFFVTSDGYLLTNHHVVEGADKITVTLNDRTELDATLVGSDERSDVAVLKVISPNGRQFPALPIGDSNHVKVGEPVLAIGSPFGFDYSASAGIVSAKSRNFSRDISVPFIQTDVALNPGNSGGPLFNQKGEVIGINSRIFSGTGGYMGLSFSIPIDAAMGIYEQIKATGSVTRAYLGVFPQDIDRNLAEAYQLQRPQGALITKVTPDSPAQKAGLQTGDVILNYNDEPIILAADLFNIINQSKPNDSFKIELLRAGKTMQLTGKLDSAPTDVTSDNANDMKSTVRLGVRMRNLSVQEQQALEGKGVLITAVDPIGLAARSGLQAGDVVTNLHQKPIGSIEDFAAAIKQLPTEGVVTIEIIRQGIPVIIGLRIEEQ
ncbi:Do family serine endopeptidase [Psychrobacter sp. I-STPA10]|uniref:Do family serine endopeptidase n=1 Tax=Psychrobacter sp. I-STPA10 TaxID=2585769 RepID=UPI001E54609C|nr:Do family serine endopeptidase [Psychrobacter sp. I-STPA10]